MASNDATNQEDDQKQAGYNATYVVNLSDSPISVRVTSDKTRISEESSKMMKDVYDRVKRAGGAGVDIGIPDVGNLGVKGDWDNEDESKNNELQESYTKLIQVMKEDGFSTLRTNEARKFVTEQSLRYISIYVNGVQVADNWANDDKEYIVNKDGSCESNAEPTVAPHYMESSMFTTTYKVKMQDSMQHVQEAHTLAKTLEDSEGNLVISAEQCKLMGLVSVDLSAINLATSSLLRVLDQHFFHESASKFWSMKKAEFEKMKIDVVVAKLYQMAHQAQEISDALFTVSHWYVAVKAEIEKLTTELQKDANHQKDEIKRLKKKIDDENENIRKQNEKLKEEAKKRAEAAKPHGFWGWVGHIVLSIVTLGIYAVIKAEQWAAIKRKKAVTKEYLAALDDSKSKEALMKLTNLSQSLEDLHQFCIDMGCIFSKISGEFKSHAETWENWGHDANSDWMKMSADDVVDWIAKLEGGKYAAYAKNFSAITGPLLPSLNKMMIKMYIAKNMPDDLVTSLVSAIVLMTDADQHKLVYDPYSFVTTQKWLADKEKEMDNLETLTRDVVIQYGLGSTGIKPTPRNPIVLTQFGTGVKPIDAVQMVEKLLN